jgi:Flp pilus assembly protein TadB
MGNGNEETMPAQSTRDSAVEVATQVNAGMAGLGILTFALFPLTVPGLVLFVIAPLVALAVVGAVLAAPFVLVLSLVLIVRRRRSRRRARRSTEPAGAPPEAGFVRHRAPA